MEIPSGSSIGYKFMVTFLLNHQGKVIYSGMEGSTPPVRCYESGHDSHPVK
jgi:hypothetical protein